MELLHEDKRREHPRQLQAFVVTDSSRAGGFHMNQQNESTLTAQGGGGLLPSLLGADVRSNSSTVLFWIKRVCF